MPGRPPGSLPTVNLLFPHRQMELFYSFGHGTFLHIPVDLYRGLWEFIYTDLPYSTAALLLSPAYGAKISL